MYESQTDALIAVIRSNPGIGRPQLIDIEVGGFRIANFTARITDARSKLSKTGETVVCQEGEPMKFGKRRVRKTRYFIRPINAHVLEK